jgi:hypothetical protein
MRNSSRGFSFLAIHHPMTTSNKHAATEQHDAEPPSNDTNAMLILVMFEDTSNCEQGVVTREDAIREGLLGEWERIYKRVHHVGVHPKFLHTLTMDVAKLTFASADCRKELAALMERLQAELDNDEVVTAPLLSLQAGRVLTHSVDHIVVFDVYC